GGRGCAPRLLASHRPRALKKEEAMSTLVQETIASPRSSSETMHAVVVHAFDQAPRVEEVTKPIPGPGEILVKTEASGLCHTDIHAAHGDWPVKPKLPFTPG